MSIATPWFSPRERSGGVQQGADFAEQFSEIEWLCQGLRAVQVLISLGYSRWGWTSRVRFRTTQIGFHGHFLLLAKGGPTPRRFLQPVGSKPVRVCRMGFRTGERGIKLVQFARASANEPCVLHTLGCANNGSCNLPHRGCVLSHFAETTPVWRSLTGPAEAMPQRAGLLVPLAVG